MLCSIKDLFVKYGFDERNILSPLVVREALDVISDEIKGFREGQVS